MENSYFLIIKIKIFNQKCAVKRPAFQGNESEDMTFSVRRAIIPDFSQAIKIRACIDNCMINVGRTKCEGNKIRWLQIRTLQLTF